MGQLEPAVRAATDSGPHRIDAVRVRRQVSPRLLYLLPDTIVGLHFLASACLTLQRLITVVAHSPEQSLAPATMVQSRTGTRLTGGAPTGDVLRFARQSSPR